MIAALMQLHSNSYRNPGQLPEGAVLIVGAGSSGVQIADDLKRAEKRVYLSVGAHDRPPRSYRGRDYCWWLGVLGKWDADTPRPGTEHVTIAVSGVRGGATVDFRHLAAQGITLVGMTKSYRDGVMTFAPDLAQNIARGDANLMALLDEADAFVARNGLRPSRRTERPQAGCGSGVRDQSDSGARSSEGGVTSIIWATGYTVDYSWLKLDLLTRAAGRSISAACRRSPASTS